MARVGDVPVPLSELWNPATIRADLLPWLAWGLSVDSWETNWSEADKRAAVAGSMAAHRIKGTRASVETVLARFDPLLQLVEWHETAPRGTAHTFEIRLPIAAAGVSPGGERATGAFARAIVREVTRVKPVREHFRLVQQLTIEGAIAILGAARVLVAARSDLALTIDLSASWDALLQTEDGEPLEDDFGEFLDGTS